MDNYAPDFGGVSVVIAAYNVRQSIERAIMSAIDGQGVATEVIVVDDASTDGTADAAGRVKDPRVRILRRQQNGGPGQARNEGIAAATFPWIAILDGDDAFAPGRLGRCIARAKAGSSDIVIDNLEVYREADGARYAMYQPKDFGGSALLDLPTFIRGNLSFLGSTSLGYVKPVISSPFIGKHRLRYDPDIRIGEDYMFLAEALACGARCAIETAPGYVYTVHKGSMSHRLAANDIERMIEGDRKFAAKYPLNLPARKAQALRDFSLNEALAFTRLVDALKQKDYFRGLAIVARRPSAAFHLWRPLWARMQKLFNRA